MQKPDSTKGKVKKEEVADMFDAIAGRYDFLNHFLSFNTDRLWRKKAISILKKENPAYILDIATGTGDMVVEACKALPNSRVVGIDIAGNMLAAGREKVKRSGFSDRISLLTGDSEKMQFRENTFDAVTVAFGVRNFSDPAIALKEIRRVLKPGGIFVVLEFSRPDYFPVKQLYALYFKNILPLIGGIISGNREAYRYLPESVSAFPEGRKLIELIGDKGFERCTYSRLTAGIATVYTAFKPQ